MRVYILDIKGKNREQMLNLLYEEGKVTSVEVFDDYIEFIERVEKSPPDICIIRLGIDSIPGMKTASMVQQARREIKILFVSENRDYAVNAHEIGVCGYLLYPICRKKFENAWHKLVNTIEHNKDSTS